jgi:hypothetical protein
MRQRIKLTFSFLRVLAVAEAVENSGGLVAVAQVVIELRLEHLAAAHRLKTPLTLSLAKATRLWWGLVALAAALIMPEHLAAIPRFLRLHRLVVVAVAPVTLRRRKDCLVALVVALVTSFHSQTQLVRAALGQLVKALLAAITQQPLARLRGQVAVVLALLAVTDQAQQAALAALEFRRPLQAAL